MEKIFIKIINFWQKTFSPDFGVARKFFPGGYCKYVPTCSEYGKLAIKKDGAMKGGVKAVMRILRCNPWSKGGIDIP